MNSKKLKEYIALLGGLLSAIFSYLTVIGVSFDWFTLDSINALETVLIASVPFILVAYGVYKNTYIVTKKAKEQAKILEEKGVK